MKPTWKPVIGYEGAYEVSDDGAVRSMDRFVACKNGFRSTKGKTLIPHLNGKGYLHVGLSSGKSRTVVVHKLVANAFLGERPEGYVINHIDGNKENNAALNLEWCTYTYNNVHALNSRLRVIPKGKDHPLFGRVGVRKGMKSSPEAVAKMIATKTGVALPRTRVLHVPSGLEFQSIAAAARYLGVKPGRLRAQVRGQSPNALCVVAL